MSLTHTVRIYYSIHLDAFVDLKASFVSEASANNFNIRTEYDLGTVLNAGDEVKYKINNDSF